LSAIIISSFFISVHGHGISREVAWNELKIKIQLPEDVPGISRSIRRFWALLYWLYNSSPLTIMLYLNNILYLKPLCNKSLRLRGVEWKYGREKRTIKTNRLVRRTDREDLFT